MKATYKGIQFEGTPMEVIKAIGLYIRSERGETVSPPQPSPNVPKRRPTLAQIYALDDELMRMKLW